MNGGLMKYIQNRKSQVAPAGRYVKRTQPDNPPAAALNAETIDVKKSKMAGPRSKQQVKSSKFENKQSSFNPKGDY